MTEYVVKRVIQGILLVIVVSMLVFLLIDLMPGDPIDALVDPKVSQEVRNEMRIEYGLDKPLPERYINWVNDILHGDFGTCIKTKLKVSDMLKQRIPVTLKLSVTTLVLEVLIAVPIGLIAAYKKDGFFDRLMMSVSLFFSAIPSFWVAVLLILVFGVTLRLLPISGFEQPKHYILPVTAMVLGGIATTIRMTKTEVIDVLREKYVLTAYAKGLHKRQVLLKHVLRNALVLITIIVFMNIPWVISGSVIIENIFVIPGMGKMLTDGILTQDYTIVQACVLIISILTVICNLTGDIVTAILDPRIRVSMGGSEK